MKLANPSPELAAVAAASGDRPVSRHHLVRVGIFGHVGRFTSVDAVSYPRGSRVICRTPRGLEVGQILAPAEYDPQRRPSDGSILRGVTVQDDLLLVRQQKNRDEAFAACRDLLTQHRSDAALMEVEQLFDGGSLYFYFLGEVAAELESLTAELAEAYDSRVAFRQFAETVEAGCGPGCGTEDAPGFCGTSGGGCSSCAISGACGTKR